MTLTEPLGFGVVTVGEADPVGLLKTCLPATDPLGLLEAGVVVTEPGGRTDADGVTLIDPPDFGGMAEVETILLDAGPGL